MNKVCLLTGSNLGDRIKNLRKARELIIDKIGILLLKSGIYETEPWGYKSTKYFLNQCLLLDTKIRATTVLTRIVEIEKQIGRTRDTGGYADRIIDIDILLYNDEYIKLKNLCIPHPKMHQRNFALIPLCEIIPDYIHPVLGKRLEEILAECTDKSIVVKVESN